MIRNYFKIAWRNLIKNKVYSFINVFGLATGMAVTTMIGLWISDELSQNKSFDNYGSIGQMYQSLTFTGLTDTGASIPRRLEFVLRENYSDNLKYVVMSSYDMNSYLNYGDNTISQTGNYMQKDAPEMFSLKILKGKKNGIDDINSIMLSESTAKALFGTIDPIGKIIKVNSGDDMLVASVYKDLPKNSTLKNVQYLMAWDHYVAQREWVQNSIDSWGNSAFQLYVQVADNTTLAQISPRISNLKKTASEEHAPNDPQFFILPMKDWYLRSNFENGVQTGGRIENVWLFGIIGSIVLLLACINFMNLSTARSEKRAMEVGIRKSIGSSRGQLIRQFLSESLLVVILAFVISIGLVLLSINSFNTLASKEIDFPWGDYRFWSLSIAFVVFTALISGSYPALYLSSFRPVKVLKGTFKVGRLATLPRKVLVITQFTVSAALIIGTLVVMKQIQHTKDRPVGYDKGGLIQIPIMSPDFVGKYDLMRHEFLSSGGVIAMSSSSSPTTEIWSNHAGLTWEGKPEDFQEDFAWTEVSPDYVKTTGMKIIEGRDFSRDFATDSNSILVNRTAVKYMGLKDPIGKYIRSANKENTTPPLKIIGVVEDVITQSPYEPVKQGFYVFDKDSYSTYYNLRLNPKNSVSENLELIENTFKTHFPNLPFQYDFVDEAYAAKFASEEKVASLARVFTILAILISCLGLFGLASFVAEQRTKEIGVRKVLGATVANLWMLLSKDFVGLVLISLLIAMPLAYYIMHQWIQKFSYRTDISLWIFIVAAAGAIIITLTTVSFQSIKAALSNPTKSLRTE